MSTVNVSVTLAAVVLRTRDALIIESSAIVGNVSQSVTSSGTAAQSTVVIPAVSTANDITPGEYLWRIANLGTDVIGVAFGSDPTASATNAKGIPPNCVQYFRAQAFGEKVSIINL